MPNPDQSVTKIRDLLYFDVEKASSLLSQFEGGLPHEVLLGQEFQKGKNAGLKVDLKVVGGSLGEDRSDKTTSLQKKILHHDLLDRVEDLLFKNNLAVDLNKAFPNNNVDSEQIHQIIKNSAYIRAEGFSIIHDFRRLQKVIENFNFLAGFINKCNLSNLEKSDEYMLVKQKIQEMEKKFARIKGQAKSDLGKEIKKNKEIIETAKKEFVDQIHPQEEWMVKGLVNWIDIFNSDQINVRLSPFKNLDNFEILTNLKPECITDTDVNQFNFSYGNRPSSPLCLLGLITQLPQKAPSTNQEIEDVLDEEKDLTDTERFAQYKQGFNKLFEAMGSLDAFGRDVFYPNIKIYPIALYRNIEATKDTTS